MKERPILFSAPMVRAILEGRKTQTRRVIEPQPGPFSEADIEELTRCADGTRCTLAERVNAAWRDGFIDVPCPYGALGDRLWVRETWQPLWKYPDETGNMETGAGLYVNYPATDGVEEWHHEDDGLVTRCRPSIHMPRWASRITLEVTDVRVERLNDISKEDAIAEGAQRFDSIPTNCPYPGSTPRWSMQLPTHTDQCLGSPQMAFANLWESINGEGSWVANPWVWVISFKRVEAKAVAA